MEKETKSKIGVLKYIASTGAKGVKFEDEPTKWYNPATDEAKEQVEYEYKGKQVEIMLVPGKETEFSSMVLLETDKKAEPKPATKKEQPKVEEEKVEEDPVEADENKLDETEESVPTGKSHVPEAQVEETEETEINRTYTTNTLGSLLHGLNLMHESRGLQTMKYTKSVYTEMETTKLETAQKGPHKLTYASWAEAWGALKRLHPTATFKAHENDTGVPVFYDAKFPEMGGFVKVSVTVQGVTHTVHLPVMDHSNKSIPMGRITTFDINKNIQRALAKAIAMHGMGLYVFKGEDYPEETK